MKTFAVLAAFLLLLIAATCWFILSFRTKTEYDRVRAGLASSVYVVRPFDLKAKLLQYEVETTWSKVADVTNGPSTEVIKLASLTPSVSNLIYVFNYAMPQYQWLSPSRNHKAASFGLLKAKFFPVSVDKTWHVSDDQHLTMLWCRTNVVYIYRDCPTGLRETLFAKKTNLKPESVSKGDAAIGSGAKPNSSVTASFH